MALNALTLAVTQGVVGRPFLSAVSGVTTGRIEVLVDGVPGFSYVNGVVYHPSLPYPVSTVVLREYEPGVGAGFRDSRIDITAATVDSLRTQALASLSGGRSLVRWRVGSTRQSDGSYVYSLFVEDDLGATAPLAIGGAPTPTPTPAPTITQPSISPGSGTAGSTIFTGTDGTPTNGTITAREWLIGGVVVATGGVFAPTSAQTGSLTYRNTVTGAGGTASATSTAVTIAAAAPVAPNVTLLVTSGLVARYNANYSTISQASSRVTSVTDLSGNGYTLTDNSEGLGPQLVTYASGLKALRFNQDSFLSNPSTPSMGPLASTIIMVVRDHNTRATNKTYLSCGTRAGTPGSKLAYLTNGTNGAAPYVGRASTSSDTTTKPWIALGSQLQVVGWRNGNTGTPSTGIGTSNTVGQLCGVNNKSLLVTNQNATAAAGFEIGRNSATTTTSSTIAAQNVANGDWLTGDIVECIIYNRALRDDEFASVMSALTSMTTGYAIPDVTDQYVLEGDSRICSVLPTLPAENPAMVMTEPGASYALPKTVRVINYAIGGATTIYGTGQSSLRGRLDYAGSTGLPTLAGLSCLIPGGTNRIAVMAGHNDLSQSALSGVTDRPAAIYANLNSCIYNASAASYLTLGWDVTLVVEMHNNNNNYINGGGGYTSYRALQRSQAGNNLLTDNNAGTGQTYDGKLRIIDMPLMRSGGASVFETQADTQNRVNYQTDSLHETAAGMAKFATGGDTPQYGLRAVWPA